MCVSSGHILRPRIVEQPQRPGRPKNFGGTRCANLQRGADLDDALLSNLKPVDNLGVILTERLRALPMPMRH